MKTEFRFYILVIIGMLSVFIVGCGGDDDDDDFIDNNAEKLEGKYKLTKITVAGLEGRHTAGTMRLIFEGSWSLAIQTLSSKQVVSGPSWSVIGTIHTDIVGSAAFDPIVLNLVEKDSSFTSWDIEIGVVSPSTSRVYTFHMSGEIDGISAALSFSREGINLLK